MSGRLGWLSASTRGRGSSGRMSCCWCSTWRQTRTGLPRSWRRPGAEHDPAAQQQLAEAVSAEMFPQYEPFRPGLLDRHRLARRLARRLNPRWQYRRWAMRAAFLEVEPAAAPDDIATVTVVLRGEEIGKLQYQACAACRQALVCKESIDQEYQGLGLGRRALHAALATAPGYEWTTTPQDELAVRFWQRMSRTTGASLTDDPDRAGMRRACN
jgi:GNAT superfamily N-acetyltransferase